MNPIPDPVFTATTVCIGNVTDFTETSSVTPGTITNWDWNFGEAGSASNTSIVQNPSHTYAAAGSYTAILTVTSNSGCTKSMTLSVIVHPQPVAQFTSSSVCQNVVTQFTDQSTVTITGWDWNFGEVTSATNTSTGQNPSHTYATSGSFTATLIVTNNNGCKDTTTNPVTVHPLPTAYLSAPDTVGCVPHCADFSDAGSVGNITQWSWNFGDGATGSSQAPRHCYTTVGVYDVSLTVTTDKGCTASYINDQYIIVNPLPVSKFESDPTVTSYLNPTFNFIDKSSGAVTWMYDFGDDSDPDSTQNPSHTFFSDNKGFYSYEVTQTVVNEFGCVDTSSIIVTINPEFTFFISNCFTPNTDEVNDFYYGKGIGIKDFKMWIFDRWGNLIWDCYTEGLPQESTACKWNGIVEDGPSGEVAQQDVYVWKVRLIDVFDKTHNYIGIVSIVK